MSKALSRMNKTELTEEANRYGYEVEEEDTVPELREIVAALREEANAGIDQGGDLSGEDEETVRTKLIEAIETMGNAPVDHNLPVGDLRAMLSFFQSPESTESNDNDPDEPDPGDDEDIAPEGDGEPLKLLYQILVDDERLTMEPIGEPVRANVGLVPDGLTLTPVFKDDHSVLCRIDVPDGIAAVSTLHHGDSHQTVLWERNARHPNGEVFMRGGSKYLTARTAKVQKLIAAGLLREMRGIKFTSEGWESSTNVPLEDLK